MKMSDDLSKLKSYVDFFEFEFDYFELPVRDNMCSIIAEVVLQAGINYDSVVKPRVIRIELEFGNLKTIDDLTNTLDGNFVNDILLWKGQSKIQKFVDLICFFRSKNINTHHDLRKWIVDKDNQEELLSVKGIGPKSIDYLMLLLGIPTIPIDRHLLSFANLSGVESGEYNYISKLYHDLSNTINVDYHVMDATIWNFMNRLLVTK